MSHVRYQFLNPYHVPLMHPESTSMRKRSAPETFPAESTSSSKRSKVCSSASGSSYQRAHGQFRPPGVPKDCYPAASDSSPILSHTFQTLSNRSSEETTPIQNTNTHCQDSEALIQSINLDSTSVPYYTLPDYNTFGKLDSCVFNNGCCQAIAERRVLSRLMSYDLDCGPGQACTKGTCDDGTPCDSGSLDRCSSPASCVGEICFDEQCLQNGPGQAVLCTDPCPESTCCLDPCRSSEYPFCSLCHQSVNNAGSDMQWQQPASSEQVMSYTQPEHSAAQHHAGFLSLDHNLAQPQYQDQHNHQHTENCGCINPSYIMREPVNLPDHYQGSNYHYSHSVSSHSQERQSFTQSQASHKQMEQDNEAQAGKVLLNLRKGNLQTDSHHQQDFSNTFYNSNVNTSVTNHEIFPTHDHQNVTSHDYSVSNIGPQYWQQRIQQNNQHIEPSELSENSLHYRNEKPGDFSAVGEESNSFTCLWLSGPANAENDGNECGAVFEDAEQLQRHVDKAHIEGLMREDKDGNGFYCHWKGCNRNGCRSFQARPKLKRHAQVHTLYKPFTCRTCGATMKTKDAMEKHERTHSGKRPYLCEHPGCSKKFATSTELRTHRVVHSGEKPHKCDLCQECFADSSNLSKHRKTHYVGMYICPVCGTVMKRWDQMRRHLSSQKHAEYLLSDEQAEKDYKEEMLKRYSMLADEEKRCVRRTSRGRGSVDKWDEASSSMANSPTPTRNTKEQMDGDEDEDGVHTKND